MMVLAMGLMVGGFLGLVFGLKHVLNMLLSLEMMVLGGVVLIVGVTGFGLGDGASLVYYLTFCACEAALGLGVLVNLVRCYGSDYYFLSGLLRC